MHGQLKKIYDGYDILTVPIANNIMKVVQYEKLSKLSNLVNNLCKDIRVLSRYTYCISNNCIIYNKLYTQLRNYVLSRFKK